MTYIDCDLWSVLSHAILSGNLEEVQAAVCTFVGQGQYGRIVGASLNEPHIVMLVLAAR